MNFGTLKPLILLIPFYPRPHKTFDSMAKRRWGEGSSEGYLCGVEISRPVWHGRLRVGWAIPADSVRVPMTPYRLHRLQRVRVPVEGGVESSNFGRGNKVKVEASSGWRW